MKYSAKPVFARKSELPKRPTDNYLRERMQEQLKHESVSFDFMVQIQEDPYAMPIEDGLIPWAEECSPFIKVATITIRQQNFDSPEEMDYCDSLSFTPWHTLPEHRPWAASAGFAASSIRRYPNFDTGKMRSLVRNQLPRTLKAARL